MVFSIEPVHEVPADQVPPQFRGITVRYGTTKPYMAWKSGRIERFCETEREALEVLHGPMG